MKKKIKESEQEKIKIVPYKCKGRKMEFSYHKPKTSCEESVKHNRKQQESIESSDHNKMKNIYIPYEEISRDFNKIKPPMFNGEIEKGEETEG